MFDVQLLVDIAIAAVALLVTVLATYLAFRLLGKLAKIFVSILVLVLVIWLLFADGSPLSDIISLSGSFLSQRL